MTTGTLTGRYRYRHHKPLLRPPVVVLQHEWHVKGHEMADDPFGAAMHQVERTEWRDARIEDVTATREPAPLQPSEH